MLKYILFIVAAFTSNSFTFSQDNRSEKIKDITHIELKKNGLIRTDSVIIQINNRMGDKDASAYILYQKGDKVSFGDIWIEDMNGNIIRKLKKNEVKDRSFMNSFSLYEDRFIKYFEARNHEYPYKVVYTYKREQDKMIDVISFDYSSSKTPINEGKLVVQHAIEGNIKYQHKNIETSSVDTIGNNIFHTWQYSFQPENLNQIYNSVNVNTAPSIDVSSFIFKYGVEGVNANWETFGNWEYRLNEGRDILSIDEQNNIKSLVSNAKNEYEKIQILYHYLQNNTRYINISTKEGGHQTHSAEYVSKNKYGDCKALTNYMQSILKLVGIKAHYTPIYSDSKVYDLNNFYSYSAFNHVILTIPLEGDTIFLECTASNYPVGYIGTSNQGRKALLVKEHGSQLINTPQLKPSDVVCIKEIHIDLASYNGEATAKIASKKRGKEYEILNYYANESNKNTLDKFVRYEMLDKSYEVQNYEINSNKDSASIKLSINCNLKNHYKVYGNNLIISSLPIDIPTFEQPKIRTQNVQIDYPLHYTQKIIYNMGDKTIKKIPVNVEITSKWGDKYILSHRIEDKTLIVEKIFLMTSKRIYLDEYEEFYKFIEQARNHELSNMYIETL